MADAPQNPNASRITAMLQDLAAQKSGGQQPSTSPPTPTQPAPRPPAPAPAPSSVPPPVPMPKLVPPPNLPTVPARPTTTAPAGATPPPRPTAPPPAPREPAVSVAPLPRPPMPPPAAVPMAPPPPTTVAPILPAVTPQKPASADVSTELRTMSADVGSIKVGQAPQGVKPPSLGMPTGPATPPSSIPSVPLTPAPSMASPSIMIPETSGSGSGMTRKIIYGVLGVVVLGGIAYSLVSLMGGSTEPVATDSPTPSTSATATPSVQSLSSYIGSSKKTITLPTGTSVTDLVNLANDAVPPQGGLATAITFESNGTVLDAVGVLALLDSAMAQEWKPLAGIDQAVLLYGQKEHFDAMGAPDSTKTVDSRFIFIIEVPDASAASRLLTKQLVPDDRSECTGYNAGAYRQIPIQYRNCPFADIAEDYAIMLVSNQKNYLIITESREAMFFAIDQLSQ